MRWTAEAIETLIRLALEGRSASFIAAALGAASRNAVIGKANRIGVKLNGDGRASAPSGTSRAALSCAIGGSSPLQAGCRQAGLRPRRLSRSPDPRVTAPRPGCGKGRVDFRRGGGSGDAAGEVRGHSRIRLSMATRRSEERGFRLLRAEARPRPLLLRRPLPDGLSRAGGGCEPASEAFVPRARRSVAVSRFRWRSSRPGLRSLVLKACAARNLRCAMLGSRAIRRMEPCSTPGVGRRMREWRAWRAAFPRGSHSTTCC